MENNDKLFEIPNDTELWKDEWQDMPEFVQEDIMPWKTLYVHFENKEDREDFSKLINQKLTDLTQYVWYPEVKKNDNINWRYIDEP